MLGFNALGKHALGEVQIKRNLPVTAGVFTLTGNAVTFLVTEATSAGAFSLTGIAATFNVTMVESAGAFALTGFNVIGNFPLPVTTGLFTLTGFATTYSIDYGKGSPGSSISGGMFTRGQWHKLKKEQETAEEERRQAEAAAEAEHQAETERKAEEERQAAAAEAARRAELAAAAEREQRRRLLVEQIARAAGARTTAQALGQIGLSQLAAHHPAMQRAADYDDEEAAARLLL
jgi:hypothetical protein